MAKTLAAKPALKKADKPRKTIIPDGVVVGSSDRKRLAGDGIKDIAKYLTPAAPPPGVVPKGSPKIAMDEGVSGEFNAWLANSYYNLAFIEGYTFLGYPYLSQLAQISEYRQVSETIATEATRKWIEIKSASDDKAQADRIKELTKEFERLGVREAFKTISEQDGFFGRSHLYLDTGDTDDRPELMTPLGNGDKFTEKKLGKRKKLRALKVVEPVWCYPSRYDASDPLQDSWYKPSRWFVNGKELDSSRLLTFVGRPVPDLFKPAFSFGGLSMSQMVKPYVDNWLQTRQSVNDIIQAFSVMVLSTDLSALMQTGGADLDRRIALFNTLRNNKGVFVLNKDAEEFTNVSAPLGSLDKLQAQAQEHMAAPARIPLVKLLGITPSGLNASSDGEIRCFYDNEHAYQEYFFTPHLRTVFRIAQINLWGEVDEDLTFIYKPLWELTEEQLANVKKIEADTDGTLVDKGIIDPSESRTRLANDPDQPYGDIDPEDVPEVTMPEPEHIRETEEVGENDPEDAA